MTGIEMKALRKKLGLTQKGLSQLSEKSYSLIQKYEQGVAEIPKVFSEWLEGKYKK